MNPLQQQKELREFCKAKGIHVSANAPLGSPGTKWGDNRILDCDVLKEIAEARGKTTAQVSFSFCLLIIEEDHFNFHASFSKNGSSIFVVNILHIQTWQINLRWAYEQGASVITKSFNKDRMRENLEIFDWLLGMEDLDKISGLPQRKGCSLSIVIELSEELEAEL